MMLADWSLGVDTLIIILEADEMPMNISVPAEVGSVYNWDPFYFAEIILLCIIFFGYGLYVYLQHLVQRSIFIARHVMKKIIECMKSTEIDIWLRSLLRKMVRIAFCAISAGLMLSGLYLSAYEDAKASVLVFSGVASTIFTTKYIFSDVQKVNKTVLIGVKFVAYVMFLGFYCQIFPELWATGAYSVFLGNFLLETMRNVEHLALENSLESRLSGSMSQRSGPLNGVKETIEAAVEVLQGMPFDMESECPNQKEVSDKEVSDKEDGAVNKIDLSFIYSIHSHA